MLLSSALSLFPTQLSTKILPTSTLLFGITRPYTFTMPVQRRSFSPDCLDNATSSSDRSDSPSPSTSKTIITGRKNWKRARNSSVAESVWDPELEAAFFEGLEKYRPGPNSDSRRLRRFPNRNRIISEYIFDKTGRKRTPKQVGSRLQQLKSTCEDKRILALIQRRDYPQEDGNDDAGSPLSYVSTSPSASESELGSPTEAAPPSRSQSLSVTSSSRSAHFQRRVSGDRQVLVQQPIKAGSQTYLSIDLSNAKIETTATFSAPSFDEYYGRRRSLVSLPHNPMGAPLSIPSVSLTSGSVLDANYVSQYHVYQGDRHVYSERAPLVLVNQQPTNSKYTYSSKFVPEYWGNMTQWADASHFCVMQDVVFIAPSGQQVGPSIWSGVYEFVTSSAAVPEFTSESLHYGSMHQQYSNPPSPADITSMYAHYPLAGQETQMPYLSSFEDPSDPSTYGTLPELPCGNTMWC